MPRLKYRSLGAVAGVCACCNVDAELRLEESSPIPTLRERLHRQHVPHVQRTATCSACRSTYPVRAGDPTPAPAARRTRPAASTAAPRRSTDAQTIGTGRDWRDTRLPV